MGVLVAISLVCDIITYSVKNLIVFPAIIVGIITNIIFYGIDGLFSSLMGFVLPVILLFVLYALKMLGAGDIKLFAAIGAIMGYKFVLWGTAFSFISGGIIAVVIILINRNSKERFGNLYSYLKTCFYSRSLKPYSDSFSKNKGSNFHFTYAVALGTLATVLILH